MTRCCLFRVGLSVLLLACLHSAESGSGLTEEEYQRIWQKAGGKMPDDSIEMPRSRMARPVDTKHNRAGVGAKQKVTMHTPTKEEEAEALKIEACLQDRLALEEHSYYDSMRCYDLAISHYPLNATWHKRRGTLHFLADAPSRAVEDYNKSVAMLFSLARYGTKSESMQSGSGLVDLLTLFERRDIITAVEIGKLAAVNASYHHRPEDALSLYSWLLSSHRADEDVVVLWGAVQHIASYGMWHKAPLFLQKLSAAVPEYAAMSRMLFAFRVLVESADLVGQRLLRTNANATGDALAAGRDQLRETCGREDLPHKLARYTRQDVVGLSGDCFLHNVKNNAGFARAALEDKVRLEKEMVGSMQETPLHMLASLAGTSSLLREVVKLGVGVHRTNRFGQSPLHVALSMGNFAAAQVLLKEGAALQAKDFKQRTPVEAACAQGSWIDRAQVASLVGEDVAEDICELDEDVDVVSQSSSKPRKDHGGWAGASGAADSVEQLLTQVASHPQMLPGMKKHNRNTQIDIIDASSVEALTVASFMTTSRPVLIRGGVGHKVAAQFSRKQFTKRNLHGRVELFPYAEHSGAGVGTVSTFEDFCSSATEQHPRTFTEKVPVSDVTRSSDVRHTAQKHPLKKLSSSLGTLGGKSGKLAKEDQHLSFGKRGSGFQASVRSDAVAHTLPYGLMRWFLFPPPHAFVSREHPLETVANNIEQWRQQVTSHTGRAVLECEQRPGEVLVVPPQWGSVGIRMRESISMWRKLSAEEILPQTTDQEGEL